MAEQHPQAHPNNANSPLPPPPEETTDHGCFDFIMRKKEPIAKPQEEDDLVVITDPNMGQEQKHTLMDELQRTNTHSTSSSEEKEVEEGGERKKKKKKGLKDAITENIGGHKQGEDIEINDAENFDEEENTKPVVHPADENKGFIEKIKDRLHVPGQHKTSCKEEDTETPPPLYERSSGSDNKEKGIIDKIKEKFPGGHHKSNENGMKED